MLRQCKVCGAAYETCASCEKQKSWRIHTDTAEHYYILTVLMTYLSDQDAKKAYRALRKRKIDLRERAGYAASVQRLLQEINDFVHDDNRDQERQADAEMPKPVQSDEGALQ